LAKQFFGSKVSNYLTQDHGIKRWKNLLQCTMNNPKFHQKLNMVQQLLMDIRLPLFPRKDELLWYADKKGRFSVKSAYLLLVEDVNKDEIWEKVWNCKSLPKINFFWWTATHNKILT